jgi:hypothetical protein
MHKEIENEESFTAFRGSPYDRQTAARDDARNKISSPWPHFDVVKSQEAKPVFWLPSWLPIRLIISPTVDDGAAGMAMAVALAARLEWRKVGLLANVVFERETIDLSTRIGDDKAVRKIAA